MHYDRGLGACSNTLLIARRTLENQLLAGLQEKVLHPDVIAYALGAFEEQSLLATKRRGEKSTLQQRRGRSHPKTDSQLHGCNRRREAAPFTHGEAF